MRNSVTFNVDDVIVFSIVIGAFGLIALCVLVATTFNYSSKANVYEYIIEGDKVRISNLESDIKSIKDENMIYIQKDANKSGENTVLKFKIEQLTKSQENKNKAIKALLDEPVTK